MRAGFKIQGKEASTSLGEMASAATFMRDAFRQMAITTRGALDVLAGAVSGVTNLLTGDFSQAAAGAHQALYGLVDPIANLLGFTVRMQEANPILVLAQHAREFNAVDPQLAANLALLNNARLDVLATRRRAPPQPGPRGAGQGPQPGRATALAGGRRLAGHRRRAGGQAPGLAAAGPLGPAVSRAPARARSREGPP